MVESSSKVGMLVLNEWCRLYERSAQFLYIANADTPAEFELKISPKFHTYPDDGYGAECAWILGIKTKTNGVEKNIKFHVPLSYEPEEEGVSSVISLVSFFSKVESDMHFQQCLKNNKKFNKSEKAVLRSIFFTMIGETKKWCKTDLRPTIAKCERELLISSQKVTGTTGVGFTL